MPISGVGFQFRGQKVAIGFKTNWNFPLCIRTVHGKQVHIKPPANTESTYYNYQNTFALFDMVDADYLLLYFDEGCNGRMSDGGIFVEFSLDAALQHHIVNVPSVKQTLGVDEPLSYNIVADDTFPLPDDNIKPNAARHFDKRATNF
jgi:DDE superfamily endonuclease